MAELIDTDGFSQTDQERIGVIAGLMIPADDGFGAPSAADPAILSNICRLLLVAREGVVTALAGVSPGMTEQEGQAWIGAAGPVGALFTTAVAQAYYQDDRVLAALGLEPGPPFPRGNETPQGDWSLLDPVRQRKAFYREA